MIKHIFDIEFSVEGKIYKYILEKHPCDSHKSKARVKSRLFEENEEIYPRSIREYLFKYLKICGIDTIGLTTHQAAKRIRDLEI